MLKTFLNLFKIVFPFEDFLYILQLEEYDNKRYLQRLPRFFFRRNIQQRDNLKYTSRIQTTALLSVGLFLLSFSLLFISPLLLPVLFFSIPIQIWIANNFLTPFYEFMKLRIQKKAAILVSRQKNLKIIAIAGSYGKTTTKNFLFELLKYNYVIQMVPGNINTPTGIAAWLLKNFDKKTEILLVEMDTYFIGEIMRSCMVTPPDIAVITSIGDQHLERFGSSTKLAHAISEVFIYSKKDAELFVFNDTLTKIKKYLRSNKKLTIVKNEETTQGTSITSHTAKVDLNMALNVASRFDVPKAIVSDTLKNLTLPERRQKPTNMHGYDAIDDSYNISATTAREGVLAASRYARKARKKLLVITAGIPELGPENKDANKKYGVFLSKSNCAVIVLESVFCEQIMKKGFERAKNLEEAIKLAHEQYSQKYYILLMQPELTDLYY